MKQCPTCRTKYTDETLRYCLADGSVLTPIREDRPTVLAARNEPVRVDIPSHTDQPPHMPPPEAVGSGSRWIKAVVAFGLLGLLFLIAAGVAVALLYFNTRGRETRVQSATPSPSASPSPTPDPEKQRLQDELANIQRKLDEQKNSNRAANIKPSPTHAAPGTVTARVNSPKDGFLALRKQPDPEHGERLAKIPHGTVVTLNNCEKAKVSIANRTGRWCQVDYAGQTGWVFDAWLDY